MDYWPQELSDCADALQSQPPFSFSGAAQKVSVNQRNRTKQPQTMSFNSRNTSRVLFFCRTSILNENDFVPNNCERNNMSTMSSLTFLNIFYFFFVRLQPSPPAVIARGCHHEDFWAHERGELLRCVLLLTEPACPDMKSIYNLNFLHCFDCKYSNACRVLLPLVSCDFFVFSQTYYADGEYIIHQGSVQDNLYVISKGQVKLHFLCHTFDSNLNGE